MLCEYSHTKSKSLAQICTTMAEIQHFLSRGLFLLAHEVMQLGNDKCAEFSEQLDNSSVF